MNRLISPIALELAKLLPVKVMNVRHNSGNLILSSPPASKIIVCGARHLLFIS